MLAIRPDTVKPIDFKTQISRIKNLIRIFAYVTVHLNRTRMHQTAAELT